jgi:hypothetical protein
MQQSVAFHALMHLSIFCASQTGDFLANYSASFIQNSSFNTCLQYVMFLPIMELVSSDTFTYFVNFFLFGIGASGNFSSEGFEQQFLIDAA